MKTIIIQINNSDHGLSQARWSRLCGEIHDALKKASARIYFYGFSKPDSFVQNACWIFVCDDEHYDEMKLSVSAYVKAQKSEHTYWYEGDVSMTPAHLLS